MTIPGTQVVSRAAPPSQGGTAATGTWHIAALAERGPTDSPRMLYSLSDYDRHFGGRVTYGQRDAVEAFFRNGGTAVNMIRIVGPAATKATINLNDGAGVPAPSLAVDGVGAGASTLRVAVEIYVDGRFVIVIYEGATTRLETSPPLTLPADAVAWANNSPYVRIRAVGALAPAVRAVVALAGGADDRAAVTDTHRIAALNLIPAGSGPGQVSIPGATTTAAHTGVAAHAEANNRFAILDAADGSDSAGLVTIANDIRVAVTPARQARCFLVEGWHTIPGMTPGTTRVVPPSAIVSALMAARDATTGNPNDPAAGVNGIPSYTLGLARAGWSDTQRGTLNLAGVNVFRNVAGQQRLYGYRTLVDPNGTEAGWLNAANARLRMAIQFEADKAAEAFVFAPITKAKIAEYQGVLTGTLLKFYGLGALYGGSPEEAFAVDTGTTVNTPERMASRQLSAVVGVRMNEFAEIVYFEFVKIPFTEEL